MLVKGRDYILQKPEYNDKLERNKIMQAMWKKGKSTLHASNPQPEKLMIYSDISVMISLK